MSDNKKVVQFPVDMDRLQKDIMIGLLNARRECREEGVLTSSGWASVIDALFYLVKIVGSPVKYIDKGDGTYFVGIDINDIQSLGGGNNDGK